jgi:hypothetical protein
MTSFGKVSYTFNKSLEKAADDHIIKASEITHLKEIAVSEDEKAIVELFAKDKTHVDFAVNQDGKSLATYSLEIDFDDTPKPDIKGHKDDVLPLEIKKWQGYTPENLSSYKKAIPDNKGKPLTDEQAELLTENVFSSDIKEFQDLIGEKNNDGKFGAKSFFLMQEYLAGQVNGVKGVGDCQEIRKQLNGLKEYFPGIVDNHRYKELEATLKYKTANFIHDEINLAGDLEQCQKIRIKLDNIKDSVAGYSRLTDLLNDKTQEILNPLIHNSANLGESFALNDKIKGITGVLPAETLKSIEGNLLGKISLQLDEKIKTVTNVDECIELFTKMESVKNQFNPETYKLLEKSLILKSINAVEKITNDALNLKDSDIVKEKIKLFKNRIPEPTIKLLDAGLETKIRKVDLYGHDGVTGIKPDDVEQGSVDDCYFMSSIAGIASQRPLDIIKMITPSEDGRFFTVKFPGAKFPVTVAKPTEEELKKNARKGAGGSTWPAVLEKAFAAYSNKEASFFYKKSLEAIDGGDLLSRGIYINTGHDTDTDIISLTKDSTIRNKIEETLKDKRIITMSSFWSGSKDKGVGKDHVYSVLAYDRATDTVTIRNPYGPGSDAKGLKYKDANNDGTYKITISELNKYFSLIAYEEKE